MYVMSELSDEFRRLEDKESFYSYASFFAGNLVSVLTCEECNATLHNIEGIFDLSLQIPGAESLMTLPPVVAKAKNNKKKGGKTSAAVNQSSFAVLAELEENERSEGLHTGEEPTGENGSKSVTDAASSDDTPKEDVTVEIAPVLLKSTISVENVEDHVEDEYPLAQEVSDEEIESGKDALSLHLEYPSHSRQLWSKETSSGVSLEHCLDAFTAPEILCKEFGNAHRCQNCCTGKDGDFSTRSSKRILLLDPPGVLSIHLKRLLPGGKCTTFVEFPEELDMADYVATRVESDAVGFSERSTIYRLISVIVHQGGASGGHYVAYVKRNSEWFYTSDSHVTRTSLDEVLKQQAYMLYYLREGETNEVHDGVVLDGVNDCSHDEELAKCLAEVVDDEDADEKIKCFKLAQIDGKQVYIRDDDGVEIGGGGGAVAVDSEQEPTSPLVTDDLQVEFANKLSIGNVEDES
jgi:hypothetical protein